MLKEISKRVLKLKMIFKQFCKQKKEAKKTGRKRKKKEDVPPICWKKTNIFVDTSKQERKKRRHRIFKQNARNHFSTDRKKTKHCTNKCQKCSTKQRKQRKLSFFGRKRKQKKKSFADLYMDTKVNSVKKGPDRENNATIKDQEKEIQKGRKKVKETGKH